VCTTNTLITFYSHWIVHQLINFPFTINFKSNGLISLAMGTCLVHCLLKKCNTGDPRYSRGLRSGKVPLNTKTADNKGVLIWPKSCLFIYFFKFMKIRG
jgi:hypothetical protein